MGKFQESVYRNDADCIDEYLKIFGYLPYDIVAVAYFMLKNNLNKAGNLQMKENELNQLLSRAEILLEQKCAVERAREMDLKKVGEINNIKDIPFDKPVIVSGTMSNGNHGWVWRMLGVFIKNENGVFFRNHNDMNTKIDENTVLGLNILER